jgi:hypothetical protein
VAAAEVCNQLRELGSKMNRISATSYRQKSGRKTPLRPFEGRGRGPRSGRVRWAAPGTGSSAPLTLSSPPGQRWERIKRGGFLREISGGFSEKLSMDFPRTALRFRGGDDDGLGRAARMGGQEPARHLQGPDHLIIVSLGVVRFRRAAAPMEATIRSIGTMQLPYSHHILGDRCL